MVQSRFPMSERSPAAVSKGVDLTFRFWDVRDEAESDCSLGAENDTMLDEFESGLARTGTEERPEGEGLAY